MRTVASGAVEVGQDLPPYIVAEVDSNHNGDLELCRRLIDAAAKVGADAVEFQSWSESSLTRSVATLLGCGLLVEA